MLEENIGAIDCKCKLPLSYNELLDYVINRKKEIEDFEIFLREKTSWVTSPASTRFHLACEGGLIIHSVNVANTLLKLRDLLAPELSKESCVIAALYHDIGKIGMPGKPYYRQMIVSGI